MEQITPEMQDYVRHSPLLAAAEGKDEDARWLLFQEFELMDNDARALLTSPETADTIKSWGTSGLFPTTHTGAVAKLIGLVALREVEMGTVQELLQKIGLSEEQASQTTAKISELLAPILAVIAAENVPPMEAIPPLTPSGQTMDTITGPQTGASNTLNLRGASPSS